MSQHEPRLTRDPESPEFIDGERLHDAIMNFAAAAMRADEIDPITTELVRLRCAQVHDCRLCGSLRYDRALDLGFNADIHAKVACYDTSDLGPRAIAALRLADAIILHPADVDEQLADELHRHFTDAQIAELCLDVVKWSEQKQLVSLRIEAPLADEPMILTFDEEGRWGLGGMVSAYQPQPGTP